MWKQIRRPVLMQDCSSANDDDRKLGFLIDDDVVPLGGADAPLVLYARREVDAQQDEYLNDTAYGDAALKAILSGRQVLVRVPTIEMVNNAWDDSFANSHTAPFAPVLMYQLPNYENEYLYLFYLRDEKQNIDLSAAGLGVIQMPVYGQIKLKLSQKYMECPLDPKTPDELGWLVDRSPMD